MDPISKTMFRPAVHKMAPYIPGEQPLPGERLIKLNTNENPYPPSPRIGRAIAAVCKGERLRLYPRPNCDEFVTAASELYGFPPETIIAGNGSDELLAMVFRAVIDAGDLVAWAEPTYSLYQTLAAVQQARVVTAQYDGAFNLPLEEMIAAQARLTLVCNPNSPSGTLVPRSALEELARGVAPRLLVIDEAYVDFAEASALEMARTHENVVVLRSLSKSFALAGMRLGIGFASARVIEQLLKVKDSYNLSAPAQAAGAAALRDAAWMHRNVERVRKTRAATEKALRALGFEVPPSAANFVLARMPGVDLAWMAAALRQRGILVRYFATDGLRDCLRISIGKPAAMRELERAFKELVVGATQERSGSPAAV